MAVPTTAISMIRGHYAPLPVYGYYNEDLIRCRGMEVNSGESTTMRRCRLVDWLVWLIVMARIVRCERESVVVGGCKSDLNGWMVIACLRIVVFASWELMIGSALYVKRTILGGYVLWCRRCTVDAISVKLCAAILLIESSSCSSWEARS